jgi:hypothetical protein
MQFEILVKRKNYEGESVNTSEMDIKLKTCDSRTWKKTLFLEMSFTNIDTFSYHFSNATKPAA